MSRHAKVTVSRRRKLRKSLAKAPAAIIFSPFYAVSFVGALVGK